MKPTRLVCLFLLASFAAPDTAAADGPPWKPSRTNHWAWKQPVRPPVPSVLAAAWVHNPIDAFLLARLEAPGLTPAPPAGREQLLRRVTYDLIGLPPTPGEIDAFVNDQGPTAWEKVIDRLLGSPHYGERWGRHWLDLVRYADSNGYEHDEVRPDAWRYRDYVIAAFNADLPYDRFLQEQLAGDELAPDDPRALTATGFNLLGPDMTDAASQAQRRQNTLDDMTDATGLVFLGLTVGCARCHNHKFEPILQRDYYRLQAFFAPAEFRRDLTVAGPQEKAAYEQRLREYEALTRPTREALERLEAPYRARLRAARLDKLPEAARLAHQTPKTQRTPPQKELAASTECFLAISAKELGAALSKEDRAAQGRLQQELKKLEARKPSVATAVGLQESGKAAHTFVLRRGELKNPGDEVEPGWPLILSPGFEERPAALQPVGPQSSGRRSALAQWIASPDNPLTARVLVNRLWQHHFGRGIVDSPNDFGVRGRQPTHPELLDWLATEFVARGWSVKQMHRLMLTSAAYQQSTTAGTEALHRDPDNALFSRMNRQRLEGEPIRDSLLSVAGRLNSKMGGPGVFPPMPEALTAAKAWQPSPDPADHARRSVYTFVRRNLRFAFLEPFDLPDTNQSCPQRERSTTAPQALALLNAPEVAAAAAALAGRLEQEAAAGDERIALAYRLTLGRRPSAEKVELAREFLRQSPLSEFCRALLNTNEFIYLD